MLPIVGALALAPGAWSAEAPAEDEIVAVSVGTDDRIRIEVPSAADRYHVLYYRADAAATEYPVAVHAGQEGSVVLTEPLRAGQSGRYRVATFANDAPGDADGDGADDLSELARANPGARAPLNRAASLPLDQGAAAVPDLATFRTLATRRGRQEYLKFTLVNVGAPWANDRPWPISESASYFVNTNSYESHNLFEREVGLSLSSDHLRGSIDHYPNVAAPGGEVGTFCHHYYWARASRVGKVARAHELLAASMPFLRNNLVYCPQEGISAARYEAEKASYAASRVPVYLPEDLGKRSVFRPLNAAVGYGLLRVLDGERPTFRDVVILRHIPNELSTVAGVISLERQTPLSHVNLRAVQDGVPNAYLGNALDDPMVAGLVGRYVRYEVARMPEQRFEWTDPATGAVEVRAGYLLTEATAEEVAAHHAARRPAEAQTPARDLSVTAYRDLDAIAFGDSDAFGVKAANLAVLRTFGLTDVEVPDGYALPFHYYDAFMKHNGFYDDVDDLLEDGDFQASVAKRDAELRRLRRRIGNGAVPAWMRTSLATLQGLFAEGTSIRCRSSTNNEDLPGFSGAGLYDSVTHHPSEGHLEKSVKQVFASLWNLRAFEERAFYRVDHRAAAMGVLLHPNFSGERVNGVAVSDDPVYGTEDAYYVNAQAGEELVTNPSSAVVPEELLLVASDDADAQEGYEVTVVNRSNLVADGVDVLSDAHTATLYAALTTIHGRFETLYGIDEGDAFSMEIEFKVTADDRFAVKQARPWVY